MHIGHCTSTLFSLNNAKAPRFVVFIYIGTHGWAAILNKLILFIYESIMSL